MTKDEFLKREAEGISHRNVKETICEQCGRTFEYVWIPQLSKPNLCLECVFAEEEKEDNQ